MPCPATGRPPLALTPPAQPHPLDRSGNAPRGAVRTRQHRNLRRGGAVVGDQQLRSNYTHKTMLRLRDDVRRLPAEAMIRIIKALNRNAAGTDAAYVWVINELWRRPETEAKNAATEMVREITGWPQPVLGELDSELSLDPPVELGYFRACQHERCPLSWDNGSI
jgi:hypothetical protein